jgi:hypothetical protein
MQMLVHHSSLRHAGCAAGSGKSHWAKQFMRDKSGYTLLGVNATLDQMRVSNLGCAMHAHFSTPLMLHHLM